MTTQEPQHQGTSDDELTDEQLEAVSGGTDKKKDTKGVQHEYLIVTLEEVFVTG